MEISLTSYRVFYEVASESNISRAARKLSISQPAISKSLSKLEAGLGTKLLKRSSRGVALTPEGEVLYARLKDAFGYIEKGEREIRQMRDFNIGQLKMGASTTLSKYILMPYLKDYFRDYPYTKVTIENNPSAPTIERVEKGALDLGIVVVNHHILSLLVDIGDGERIAIKAPMSINATTTLV
ncbi:MAG: LysR family transcriptional regulator, partial [Lachnospiraceae bacterium]|nr:LysR family transcriptional regulator [Lachnospiraceae bacterium]